MHFYQGFHALIGENSSSILWWQMSIRAVFVFLYGLVLIRLFGVRPFGRQTPLDIVIAIVIGSNLSRALTGSARFLPTLAATAVIVLMFWMFAHVAARSRLVGWLLKGQPVRLMQRGALDEAALRAHAVSRGDLEEAGRTSGIASLDGVQEAYLERSGKISVLKRAPPRAE
ncbi:MAG: DUF421 domain-containing protein [Pseudolabrys sp.]|jgi:uncharacterized membrane protein YcaP (DUF421 family)